MAENSSGEPLVIQRVRPREAGRLALASEAVGLDGAIGDAYSAYHDNMSPPLMWTGMPEAETYALVLEDPDAPGRPSSLPGMFQIAQCRNGRSPGASGSSRTRA